MYTIGFTLKTENTLFDNLTALVQLINVQTISTQVQFIENKIKYSPGTLRRGGGLKRVYNLD